MKKILMALVICLALVSLVSCKNEIKPLTAVNATYVFSEDSFEATKAYMLKEGFATEAEVNAITYDMFLAILMSEEGVNLEKCSFEFRSDNTFKQTLYMDGSSLSQEGKYRITEDFEIYVYIDGYEDMGDTIGEFCDGNMNYFYWYVSGAFLGKK